jgi:hypothetical protein
MQTLPATHALRIADHTEAWQRRHNQAAWTHPVASLMKEWQRYAVDHHIRYDSRIGDDYVLGPAWEGMAVHLRDMLNGDLGGMDAGTCDQFILDVLSEHNASIDH